MRINADTTITGERVVLVPYRPEHVPRYHGWMASPELQALTASEPLSLEEEFAMQRAWADDGDKLSFILLDPSRPPAPEQADWPPGGRVGAMAGDVNAFFNDPDGDRAAVELEVMVAEPESRRRGVALEALRLFMAFCARDLGVARFTAKIGAANAPSIALFRDRLGFREVRRVAVFDEVHFELRLAKDGGGGDEGGGAEGSGDAADDGGGVCSVNAAAAEELRALGAALRLGRYDG